MHTRIVDLIDFNRHHLFQLLDLLLHLYGFGGLIAKAFYEVSHLCHFLLLVLIGTLLLLTAFAT